MMRNFLSGLTALTIATSASAITIEVDFTHDGGYFAGNLAAKATVEKAAQDLSAALANAAPLGAISSNSFEGINGSASASFDWTFSFRSPQNPAQTITLPTFTIAANAFRIYAGAAASLDGEELGAGAPIGVAPELSYLPIESEAPNAIARARRLSNATLSRGRGPAFYLIADNVTVGTTQVDYTLRVGAVAGTFPFDSSEVWNFHANTLPGPTQFDFYTVVLHEMIHSLGFGNSRSWFDQRSGANWQGTRVQALGVNGMGIVNEFYNPGTPQQTSDGAHIAPGTMSTTFEAEIAQEAVMTPTLAKGERRKITHLDIAFLLDIGYDPALPAIPIEPDPTPDPTPTPDPDLIDTTREDSAPPAPPIVSGGTKRVTAKSKIAIGGSLLSPPGTHVLYKIGSGRFVRAKGGAAWKITAKLKLGKNIITIVSYNPVTDETSAPRKVIVTRTSP